MSEIAAVLKSLVVHCAGHDLYSSNLCISFFLLELQCVIEGAFRQRWSVVGYLDVCRCKSMTFTCLLERFSVCTRARHTTKLVGGCTSGC